MNLFGLVNIVKVCEHAVPKSKGGGLLTAIIALVVIGLLGGAAYRSLDAMFAGVAEASREANVAMTWLLVIVVGAGVLVGAAWLGGRLLNKPREDAYAARVSALVDRRLTTAHEEKAALLPGPDRSPLGAPDRTGGKSNIGPATTVRAIATRADRLDGDRAPVDLDRLRKG